MNGPLTGCRIAAPGGGVEHAEARSLLALLGADVVAGEGGSGPVAIGIDAIDPDAAWARSGAMWLTGEEDGPPLAPAAPVAGVVRGVAAVVRVLSALAGTEVDIDGPRLLGERAAIAGLGRHGRRSAGGACRLLPAADGWIAVNLARPDDIELAPAWLGTADVVDDESLAAVVAERVVSDLVEQGQLLGLPVAAVAHIPADEQLAHRRQAPPFRPMVVHRAAATRAPRPAREAPLVVDLSSLWAGPLCAHLLGLAGARVVKVESTARPDGARRGPAPFFDLLHGGHESVALDFADDDDLAALHALVGAADVVIEASRPRAFAHLGLDPAAVLASRAGLTWVTLTGYGRTGPWSNRVAYGDDAAAAGGLVVGTADGPVFCADAVADPLAGLYGAAGALAGLVGGGGFHIDVALREVAASVASAGPERPSRAAYTDGSGGWVVDTADGRVAVERPMARTAAGRAADLGRDTDAVLGAVGIRR